MMDFATMVGILFAVLAPPMPAGAECAIVSNELNRAAWSYPGGPVYRARYVDTGRPLRWYTNGTRVKVPATVLDATQALHRGTPGPKVRMACNIDY